MPAPNSSVLTPAGTCILLAQTGSGIEVLLLERSTSVAFPGVWVFPGGKVSAEDTAAPDVLRAAAVRELAEETGIVLDTAGLVLFARWLPPPIVARRFDTYFYVAATPGREVTVDGGEIMNHLWCRPDDAIRRHAAGSLPLAPPTWMTLQRLTAFDSVEVLLAEAGRTPVETQVSIPVTAPDGTQVVLWAGDAAYESAQLDDPGPRNRLYLDPGGWRYEGASPGLTPT
jgi:8-oxo-dGTP pyrophosphatase MutT (NUDIX family)